MTYSLLDSGNNSKLEQFGSYLIQRPCAQAFWKPQKAKTLWSKTDATFSREKKEGWKSKKKLPESWTITFEGIKFKLSPTDFGHLGIFPEHGATCRWIKEKIALKTKTKSKSESKPNILNLFAYSGAATLAAAQAGASVCHLDASKGMVAWARENAALNNLSEAPIRWIVDDVTKFLERELRRGRSYDGILLDPPTFGRGSRGELFKIEEDLHNILILCKKLLCKEPLFLLFSCHTPGYTPMVMQNIMEQMMSNKKGFIEVGELFLPAEEGSFQLPSGTFGRWSPC